MSVLKGLVSLVTGGASGLGKETATHLAKYGGSVILCDLPKSRGDEVVESMEGNVVYAPCDVSAEEDVQNMMSLCTEKFGRLDLVVNCAGLARAYVIANPLTGNIMDLNEIELVMKANLFGTFNVTRLAAQLMNQNEPNKDGQRGVIINTGSHSAFDGCAGQSAFAASKAAVSAMTLPIARDLASSGIRVVTLSPGLFDTPLTSVECLTTEVRYFLRKQNTFPQRFGHPVEFARMVESIVGNPMLNGETIKLGGGLRFFYSRL